MVDLTLKPKYVFIFDKAVCNVPLCTVHNVPLPVARLLIVFNTKNTI